MVVNIVCMDTYNHKQLLQAALLILMVGATTSMKYTKTMRGIKEHVRRFSHYQIIGAIDAIPLCLRIV